MDPRAEVCIPFLIYVLYDGRLVDNKIPVASSNSPYDHRALNREYVGTKPG